MKINVMRLRGIFIFHFISIFIFIFGLLSSNVLFASEFNCELLLKYSAKVTSVDKYMKIMSCPDVKRKWLIGDRLVGRILKGKSEEDFGALSNDPSRKIIFLMDHEGLQKIIGLSPEEMLFQIGYTQEYIARLKSEGYHFKLVVFKKDTYNGIPATWNNILKLLQTSYPQELVTKVKYQLNLLKQTPFLQIQEMAPSRFAEVEKVGKSHIDFIDEDQLVSSEGELWKVRAFLFYKLHLNELFSGDGFTYDEKGHKGSAELIVPNHKIEQLKKAQIIPLI